CGCSRIEMSANVTVCTVTTPHGQGQETSYAQITADKLGVPIEDIVVMRGDTAVAHYGRDTYGSRATVVGGTAIVMCIEKIVAKAGKLAAHLLGTKEKNVEFRDGKFFVRGKPKKSLNWALLASEAYVAKNIPKNWEAGREASTFFEPSNCTYRFGMPLLASDLAAYSVELTL